MPAKKAEGFADIVVSLRGDISGDYPDVIRALSDWLEVKLPLLDSKFDWPIPSVAGISFFSTIPYGPHQSNAKENVALKDFLSGQWVSSKSYDERLAIATWVVIN